MGKYRSLGTLFNRVFRNDLNANFDAVDADINVQKTRVDNLITGTPQPSEVVDARGKYSVLSARLSDVDVQLSNKAEKGQITNADLDNSSDSKRIKLLNLSDEVLQAMAGTTPVNATPGAGTVTEEKFSSGATSTRALGSKSVTNDKLLEKSVDLNHVSVPLPYIKPSKNLVDKTKFKTGYYISYTSGNETVNAVYNATEFIRVKPSTVYSINPHDQLAFYDSNKTYISGLGGNNGNPNTFTTPSNAAYVRVSIANINLDKVQLEESGFPTKYQAYNIPKTIDEVIAKDRITDLISHVVNPFKKTKLKLIGDSITAGVGGTGYSKTGEVMFTDSSGNIQNANIETATCWANNLKKLLETKYNGKYQWVDLTHPEIKVSSFDATLGVRDTAVPGYQWIFPNVTAGNSMMEFTFYGDKLTICYAKSTGYGIFDVYIDGVKNQSIDAYATSFTDKQTTEITGLTLGSHKVEFRETNTKNASSTANNIYIQGLRIPKTVVVKNWGISGWTSKHLELNPGWVSTDDDFILIQLGTNDRLYDGQITYTYQANFIKKMRGQGKKVILMASIPSSPSNDNKTDVGYYRNMEDEVSEIRALAHDLEVPFISNHEFFNQYTLFRGITLDSLLGDGLHPNDTGYDLMFRNIVQKLGFGQPADGVNW